MRIRKRSVKLRLMHSDYAKNGSTEYALRRLYHLFSPVHDPDQCLRF